MKHIKFIPQYTQMPMQGSLVLPSPSVAAKNLPDFYLKSERFIGEETKKPVIANYSSNAGLKACVPFLEAFTTGYLLETWCDIQVHVVDPFVSRFTWLSQPDPIVSRPLDLGQKLPRPVGHCVEPFAWSCQWAIELPKGYSVLITHPFNRQDLPFVTLTGIIDADNFHSAGNLPFWIQSNWEGIIPAGTPFAQIMPFKRDDWKSELGTKEDVLKAEQQAFDSRRVLNGFYKKLHWKRKMYQ